MLDLLLSISASLRSGEFWTHTCTFFSSPEQKAHVSFSDLNLTVVRHFVVVINFVFKFFFSRIIGPISTKRRTKHPWMKGNQVFTNKNHSIFKKEVHVMSFLSLNEHYGIIMAMCKCVYWLELFLRWAIKSIGPLVWT